MIKVTQDVIPEIGKFYLVQMAALESDFGQIHDEVPIIGHKHSDAQFGVDWDHYHLDGRFLYKADDHYRLIDKNGLTNAVFPLKAGINYCHVTEINWRKRKCVRDTTGIKPPVEAFRGNRPYAQWYDKMRGKSCKGKKCPHFGTTMHERNGHLVCPLHDLRGSMKTNRIIKHPLQK